MVFLLMIKSKLFGQRKVNDFNSRARIAISMDDHLKRIGEKQQIAVSIFFYKKRPIQIVTFKNNKERFLLIFFLKVS